MTTIIRNKITAVILAALAAVTLAVAGSCDDSPSGWYQGGGDSVPRDR